MEYVGTRWLRVATKPRIQPRTSALFVRRVIIQRRARMGKDAKLSSEENAVAFAAERTVAEGIAHNKSFIIGCAIGRENTADHRWSLVYPSKANSVS